MCEEKNIFKFIFNSIRALVGFLWIWKLDLEVGFGSWIWKLDLEVGFGSFLNV